MGAAGRRGNLKKSAREDPVPRDEEMDEEGDMLDEEVKVNPELWFDYWSEELSEVFHELCDTSAAVGLPFRQDPNLFPEFVEFAFRHSSKLRPA
jgi:hypothetical protein